MRVEWSWRTRRQLGNLSWRPGNILEGGAVLGYKKRCTVCSAGQVCLCLGKGATSGTVGNCLVSRKINEVKAEGGVR